MVLRIQAFWATIVCRQQNARLNTYSPAITYDQCHLQPATYVYQLAPHRHVPHGILERLLTALASSQTRYLHRRVLSPLRPTNVADYRHVAFWQRLRYFCRLYLQSSQEYIVCQGGVDDHARLPWTSGSGSSYR
ncbi:hypothetical protein O5340_16785 [Escherichia coli]|nr:hypothetical protein [Escherichia coli]